MHVAIERLDRALAASATTATVPVCAATEAHTAHERGRLAMRVAIASLDRALVAVAGKTPAATDSAVAHARWRAQITARTARLSRGSSTGARRR